MVRHKNRYMVVQINQVKKTDFLHIRPPSLHKAVMDKVQQLHGDFGVAAAGIGFTAKYCNERTRIAIIRCRHGPHKLVASAVPCIKFVEDKAVNINTLYVGATVKHCFKFLQRYQQMKFDEFCVGLKTDAEREAMKKTMLDLDKVLNIQ